MSIIAGAISGVLAPVIEGVISRRPAAGAPGGDPAETEVRALLETAGDVWTLDEDQYEDAVGLFNGATFGDEAPKTAGLFGSAHYDNGAEDAMTGDHTTLPEVFSGADFILYAWVKYTSGATGTVLSAESGGVEFLSVTITGSVLNISVQDVAEDGPYTGTGTIPPDIATVWAMFKIMRLGGDVFVSINNGLYGGSTSGASGKNFNWSGGSGKVCSIGSAAAGASISVDQMLYLPTAELDTDVDTWWYNSGAGRALIP